MTDDNFLMRTALPDEVYALFENNSMGVALMRHIPGDAGVLTARRVYANEAL